MRESTGQALAGNFLGHAPDWYKLTIVAFLQWRKRQAVAEVGGRNADLPQVPGRPQRRTPGQQRRAQHGEEYRGDAKEPDVELPHPEVEQVTSDERPSADPVFSLEAEHRHG